MLRAVADLIPWKALQTFLNIADVMHNTSVEVFEKKKAAFEQGDKAAVHQVGQGKDIMSVLCGRSLWKDTFSIISTDPDFVFAVRANMTASVEDRLPEDELLGQMKCASVSIFSSDYVH